MNPNVVSHLRTLTGYSFEEISHALESRLARPVDPLLLQGVHDEASPAPEWLEQGLTQWIIELWQDERAECDARDLWAVDRKYSGMLGGLTVRDFVSLTSGMKDSQQGT